MVLYQGRCPRKCTSSSFKRRRGTKLVAIAPAMLINIQQVLENVPVSCADRDLKCSCRCVSVCERRHRLVQRLSAAATAKDVVMRIRLPRIDRLLAITASGERYVGARSKLDGLPTRALGLKDRHGITQGDGESSSRRGETFSSILCPTRDARYTRYAASIGSAPWADNTP